MRRKLFIKELLDGKIKCVAFWAATCLSYVLIAVLLALQCQDQNKEIYPDVIFYGKIEGFANHAPINSNFKSETDTMLEGENESFLLNERTIIAFENASQLSRVSYNRYFYQDEFGKLFEDRLAEGRMPEKRKDEVVLGCDLAKATNVKLGDIVGTGWITEGKLAGCGWALSEEDPLKDRACKVVGILNPVNDYFDNSIFANTHNDSTFEPNSLMVFFNSNKCVNIYREKAKNLPFAENGVDHAVENYYNKDYGPITALLTKCYYVLFAVVFALLMLNYIFKGLSYKLGVMKAIGITDKYLFSAYFGGIAVQNITGYAIGVLALKITCSIVNGYKSSLFGYTVNSYRINFNMIFILFIMLICILGMFAMVLRKKICKISPKKAMTLE